MAKTNKRRRREGVGAVRPLLSGGAVSVALGAAVLLLLTAALCAGQVEESVAVSLCPAAVGLGCFAGGLIAARSMGERFLAAALCAAALGAVLWLLLGALSPDGVSPGGAVRLLLSALAGGAVAGLVCPRG